MPSPVDEQFVNLALTIASNASGKPARIRGFTGCSDAAILIRGKDIPVLIYGPGDDSLAHQPDEYVDVDKHLTAVRFYAEFATRYIMRLCKKD
ncbi:MAG: M20/M25/M40 family metallo-hydrolase [Thermacetogeniaceae bacterium]